MKIVLAMMMAAWVVVGCKAAKPEDVARQYVQALQAGDPAAFKALLDKKRQRMCYENVFRTIRPEKLEIIKVEPPYIILRYRLPLDKNWPVETGTIYLYPNGKIKYDPVFWPHPAMVLRDLPTQMQRDELSCRQSVFRALVKMQIPTFGFEPAAALEQRAPAIVQLQQWIEKNEATFDCGDPKIPLSAVDLQKARVRFPETPPGKAGERADPGVTPPFPPGTGGSRP